MRVWLSLVCLFCCAIPGWSLKFRFLGKGSDRILLLYDCDQIDDPCEEYENSFFVQIQGSPYEGDPAAFRRYLREPGIREVWIVSGGGFVDAAIEMARDLRDSHIPVRVPNLAKRLKLPDTTPFHSACVSSCTVFFMGGVIRSIDPGATYQVHSASKWQEMVTWKKDAPSQVESFNHRIREMADKPDTGLADFAREEQREARTMAFQMLRVFQNTLLVPTRKPPEEEDPDRLEQEATLRPPPLTYAGSRQEQQDINRIEAEGRAAVQDIMMRIEREQMASAIHWLESRRDLGQRADTALEMLRMMYMESIRETSTLSESELERRGYVTPEIK